MEILIFVGFVALVIVVGFFAYQANKKRRLGLQAFATQYGMTYSQSDPYGLLNYPLRLFQRGDGRGIENVVSGTWQECPVKAADYWYYTESTDSKGHRTKSYHRFSVAVVDVALGLPPVSIAREGFFTRLADHVGLRDIDFELEAFNRAWNVKAQDREFAFKLVDARMMEFLMGTEGFGYEVSGPWLLVYSKRLKPTELVPLMGTAKGFRDQIPRLVWNEYGNASQTKEGMTP